MEFSYKMKLKFSYPTLSEKIPWLGFTAPYTTLQSNFCREHTVRRFWYHRISASKSVLDWALLI